MAFKTLKCTMKENALTGITNDDVSKQYKSAIDKFCDWAKTQKIRSAEQLKTKAEKADLINKYIQKLVMERKSSATIHTYISPICSGLGLHLGHYKTGRDPSGKPIWGYDGVSVPKRRAIEIEKSRMPDLRNERGSNDRNNPKFQRLVDAAERIGLRRSEYARLTGSAYGVDVCGEACITIQGKGGKIQRQRILPEDREAVKTLFDGTARRVFSSTEMKNKLDLHSIRREHAQKCYAYYLEQIKAGKAEQLRHELVDTFRAYHYRGESNNALMRFLAQIDRSKGTYNLRGQNIDRARTQGQKSQFDRLALMCVSVWHLAHWRLDVTVRHYML